MNFQGRQALRTVWLLLNPLPTQSRFDLEGFGGFGCRIVGKRGGLGLRVYSANNEDNKAPKGVENFDIFG